MKLHNFVLLDELDDLNPRYIERAPASAEVKGVRIWDSEVRADDACLYVVTDASGCRDFPSNVVASDAVLRSCEGAFVASNVIVVPDACSISDIFTRLLEVFDDYSEWYEAMYSAALMYDGIDRMMDIAAQKLGNPFAVFDSANLVLYYSKANLSNYAGTIWDEVLNEDYQDINFFTKSEIGQINRYFSSFDEPMLLQPSRDDGHTYLMGALKVDGRQIGALGSVDLHAPFTRGQRWLVHQILRIASPVVLRSIRQPYSEDDLHCVLQLIGGHDVPPKAVDLHLGMRGWKANDSFYLLAFAAKDGFDYSTAGRRYHERVKSRYANSICMYYGNMLLAIVRKREHDVSQPVPRAELESFCKASGLCCVVSDCFNCFTDVRNAYEQCKALIGDFMQVDAEGWTTLFSEQFGKAFVRCLFDANAQGALCHPGVRELARSNRKNRDDLLQCLYAYLVRGKNVADTARALSIHRNTLLYRLQTLSDMLDVDFDKMTENESLQLLVSCLLVEQGSYRSLSK